MEFTLRRYSDSTYEMTAPESHTHVLIQRPASFGDWIISGYVADRQVFLKRYGSLKSAYHIGYAILRYHQWDLC